ncbi:hypothetical protein V8J82_13065 [Gymnodinialimonas sp. 2305UL16-5]|uniref:hypothetical protein n=1 Tax=Gymnodinialimonas mytili TaxID=3126503 RepID=UPI0030B17C70
MHGFSVSKNLSHLTLESGRLAILAADHELTMGDIGLPCTEKLVAIARDSGIPALTLNAGRAAELSNFDGVHLVLQLMGGPTATEPRKHVTATVEQALRLGATAVSLQSSFLMSYDEAEVTKISQVAYEARSFGLPTLLMISGEQNQYRNLCDCVKFAKEVGVDMLKIPFVSSALGVVPKDRPLILMSGGEADEQIDSRVRAALKEGYSGACIGRSIFEAESPIEAGKAVVNALQGA